MNFQDKWTRWHHKPIKEGRDYSSGNGWIYTAECAAVGLSSDFYKLDDCFKASVTEYGFTRHPDAYNPAISHDELIGAAFMLFFSPTFNRNVLKWKNNQYWQVCDLPGFKPTPWHKLKWFSVIMAFYHIYKLDKEYTKTGGKSGKKARHATLDYPVVFPIAFHIGAWKRYLIKRHIGMKTTLGEKLGFLVSKLFTVYSSKEFTPGKRILGFQLLMIPDKNLIERIVDKAYSSRFDLKQIAAQEYHPEHPILKALSEK